MPRIKVDSITINCCKEVVNKLSDNNTRIREKASEIVMQMATHQSFGSYVMLTYLSKP
jgi:hypothetical protein